MAAKKIAEEVIRRFPGILENSGYFYCSDFDHVLRGFFYEETPRGVYIWVFVYPIFDIKEKLHLTYSQRVPGKAGFIDIKKHPRKEWPSEFCDRIGKIYAENGEVSTGLVFFRSYIRKNSSLLRNSSVTYSFAINLLLQGEEEESQSLLQRLIETLDARDELSRMATQVLTKLECGLVDAMNFILEWEKEKVERLSLR